MDSDTRGMDKGSTPFAALIRLTRRRTRAILDLKPLLVHPKTGSRRTDSQNRELHNESTNCRLRSDVGRHRPFHVLIYNHRVFQGLARRAL